MRTIRIALPMLLLLAVVPVDVAADQPTLVVRDTDGKLVGTVVTQEGDQADANGLPDRFRVWVARRVANAWIVLPVSQNAVWATKDMTPFLYETSDCSGPALLDAPRADNEASATVVFDTQVYWPVGAGEERVIKSSGVRLADPEQCDGMLLEGNLCCTVPAEVETRFVSEASSVALAELNMRRPYHLEWASAQQAR
jgi:hypothetical protein